MVKAVPKSSVDYADYNITVYRYCPYQCRYCYVWRNKLFASRVQRGKYIPVEEAVRIAKKCRNGERVVVSFTSDPYPFNEAWMNITRNVIGALRFNGCPTVMVLTKNPILALKDRDVMLPVIVGHECDSETWLGTTITSADMFNVFSAFLEPNAPRTRLRLQALKEYQKQGGKVWISIEPIIPAPYFDLYPLSIVNEVLKVLDPDKIALVVLGRLNYVKQIRKHLPLSGLITKEEMIKEFYELHVPPAIDKLKEHSIPFHVKKELA